MRRQMPRVVSGTWGRSLVDIQILNCGTSVNGRRIKRPAPWLWRRHEPCAHECRYLRVGTAPVGVGAGEQRIGFEGFRVVAEDAHHRSQERAFAIGSRPVAAEERML